MYGDGQKIGIKHRIFLILNKVNLSFSSLIKNKSTVVLLCLMPMFSMVPIMFFMPVWAAGACVVQINVMVTVGLIYGTILFGYDNSVLNKNEGLLTKSKSYRYLSALIIIFILVTISSFVQILLMFILNWLHLLMPTWSFDQNPNRLLDISDLKFVAWFWSVYWTFLLEFALLFAFRNIINTIKLHYTLVLSLIIIAFVWGGSLNDYYASLTLTGDGTTIAPAKVGGLFPDFLYWPTVILFPFFAPGQMASLAADFTITTADNSAFLIYQDYSSILIMPVFNKTYQYKQEWNAIIFAPIIWMATLTSVGLLVKTKD